MCCSTGVCGPDVDLKLVRFARDLAWLGEQGITVERFNLAQTPAAFAESETVRQALQFQGNTCLPLILVDGALASRSIYPSREQLAALAGLESPAGCCAGDSEEACCGDGKDSSCCG